MKRLEQRLAALEARGVPTDGQLSLAERARLSASIQALLVAVRPDGIDRLCELLERLDASTTTAADRAMLASLPPCDYAPHELVPMVDNLWNEV